MSGGDRVLEGGLAPQQTYGTADSLQTSPLGTPPDSLSSASSNASVSDSTGTNSASAVATQGGGRRRTATTQAVPAEEPNATVPPLPSRQPEEPQRAAHEAAPYAIPPRESVTALHEGFAEAIPQGRGAQTSDVPATWSPERFAAHVLSKNSSVPAYTIGSVSIVQVGVLARLGWIAHVKNLYAAIPAYESASVPFSGLLSVMRPGSVSISTLVPAFVFPVRRRRKRILSDSLS